MAVQYLEDEIVDTPEVKALTRALISEMKQISENNPLFSEEMRLSMVNIDHPGKIADFITSILNIERAEQQRILETPNVQERMEQVLVFIKKEQELLQDPEEDPGADQREDHEEPARVLPEGAAEGHQGRARHGGGRQVERVPALPEAVDKLDLQGEVKEQVEQELEKFSLMDPNSSEFIVTRNYLETIVTLPWNDGAAEIDRHRQGAGRSSTRTTTASTT